MNVDKLIEVFNRFIESKLDSFCLTNPVIYLFKPVIIRVVNSTLNKLYPSLTLMSTDGNIDAEVIIPEMIDNINKMEPFNLHTNMLGEIVIGKGSIILNIPMTDRRLVINSSDLEELKNLILKN